ncbi:TetR/AcrR family transcriptional regulator, partial [Nocardioides hankookensis]
MAPKSRAENRADQTRAILDRARAQLAEVGPAALSVRQIARDVGLVSSAVYRYFPSRDHLLTALIIEAYDELGTVVEAADPGFLAWADAIRAWALAHPHEYALLYGSP